jgi:hypothetical protein
MYRAHLVRFVVRADRLPFSVTRFLHRRQRVSERSRAPTLEIDPRGAGSDAKVSQR